MSASHQALVRQQFDRQVALGTGAVTMSDVKQAGRWRIDSKQVFEDRHWRRGHL